MERKTEEISWWKLEEKKGVMTLTNADPVRHGYWIPCGAKDSEIYECACCDKYVRAEPGYIQSFDYCPHCGARMDR